MDSRKITGWSDAWLLNYAGGKIKHHEDGRNLHDTRVSPIQQKPLWMRIWMKTHRPDTTCKLAAISDKKNKLE